MVDVKLNGNVGKFILDTGAGQTLLDQASVSKFELNTKPTEDTATGAGDQLTMQTALIDSLEIGSFKKCDFELYVVSLEHITSALLALGIEKPDGIIGADILTSQNGIISYREMKLYLDYNQA
nr:retropepsin-like aspartic protease [Fulvivirga aurantia]